MSFAKCRDHYRKVLNDTQCIHPATVFDPISARLAAHLGFQAGVLGGSVVSAAILGAPDITLLSLGELVDLARRVCRASELPIMVDADHGYGNALNVVRTVEELEAAGASAINIEDTELPAAYGARKKTLISIEEMQGKLRAAVAARQDRSLVLIARCDALTCTNLEETVRRISAYQSTGVDALFAIGVRDSLQLKAIHEVAKLPLLLGFSDLPLETLATHGVRLVVNYQYTFYVVMRTIYETLKFLHDGGDPRELEAKAATDAQIDIALRRKHYAQAQEEFLG